MAQRIETAVNVNEISRISTGTVIKGEINSPTDIRIDGQFEGKIVSKGKVVVGEKAVISGDIFCENVDFWGKMTGSLYVKDTLSLKEGCVVDGDLHIRRLAVELGSKFEGNCKMLTDGEFEKLSGSVVTPKVTPSAVKPGVSGPAASAGTPIQN